MNINLTLIVQMVVFLTLIWFTMTYVWPLILGAMDERAKKIAAGLAAAEKGQAELAQARTGAEVILREARERALHIVEQAQLRANELIEHAKSQAVVEGTRLVQSAHEQITLDSGRAREQLRREVGKLAISTASKLLQREIDPRAHADLIDQLAAQV
ncbi:MAG TPA: F0F1 ATP synthase subunit B [Steroidobacteraceae bacterium]